MPSHESVRQSIRHALSQRQRAALVRALALDPSASPMDQQRVRDVLLWDANDDSRPSQHFLSYAVEQRWAGALGLLLRAGARMDPAPLAHDDPLLHDDLLLHQALHRLTETHHDLLRQTSPAPAPESWQEPSGRALVDSANVVIALSRLQAQGVDLPMTSIALPVLPLVYVVHLELLWSYGTGRSHRSLGQRVSEALLRAGAKPSPAWLTELVRYDHQRSALASDPDLFAWALHRGADPILACPESDGQAVHVWARHLGPNGLTTFLIERDRACLHDTLKDISPIADSSAPPSTTRRL